MKRTSSTCQTSSTVEIYFDGLEGRVPKYPVDYPSLERAAAEVLPSFVYSYVAGGCGDERTQRANVDAFSRFAIVPRMLVGATERDLSVSLFDMKLPTPLFMCPIGVIGLCAQDFHGDIQVAKASAQTGVPMVASTLTQDRMEDVVPHAEGTPGIFQLYTPNDKDFAASFLARAEQAGYRAVVVTLDTWTTGWRPRDLNTGNFPQLRGYVLENYFTDDVFLKRLAKSPKEDLKTAALEWIKVWGNSLRWDDLRWLRSLTKLPILLKGIQHPDDVRRAKDHGVDGIYCPPSSKRPRECRCCLTPAYAAVPTWPKRSRWGLRWSGSVGPILCIGRGRHRRPRVPTARHPRRIGPTDGHRRLPHHRRFACSRRQTHLISSTAS